MSPPTYSLPCLAPNSQRISAKSKRRAGGVTFAKVEMVCGISQATVGQIRQVLIMDPCNQTPSTFSPRIWAPRYQRICAKSKGSARHPPFLCCLAHSSSGVEPTIFLLVRTSTGGPFPTTSLPNRRTPPQWPCGHWGIIGLVYHPPLYSSIPPYTILYVLRYAISITCSPFHILCFVFSTFFTT